MDQGLKFGCNRALPMEIDAAWGCRAIYQDGTLDFVWDRQDSFGPDEKENKIFDKLNSGILQLVAKRVEEIQPKGSSDEVMTFYEDSEFVVMGSPQSSYGYIYLAAWFKEF